jgi:3-dehydroquinate synthetase
VEADQAPPAELAARIAQGLFPAPELEADLGGRACPVRAGWQAHAQAAELARGRRVVLLTDRNLQGLHLERYQKALGRCLVLAVPAGEASKSLSRLGGLHRRLAEARVSRHDLLLGVGGGMVTDLAAFAASTYMRGMPFALCATSLVGCVDAAVGGKAAVNVGPHKNLAGLFTRPEAVLLDLAALASLPRRRIAEGLAEALKTGLALDAGLFELVEAGLPRALAGDTPLLARIAALAAAAKARVVGRDFREAGPRQVLNLGHTFGHALEGFHRYRLSHGRAVAAGLVVAAAVSARRGLIGPELYGRVLAACRRLLPRRLAWPAPAQAWELMASDKKNRGGRVSFVLLAGLGRARVCRDLGLPELDRALAQAEEDLHG